MDTGNSPSDYTWEITEINGIDADWNEFVLRGLMGDE